MTELTRKYFAEFVGTFILVLVGTMSIVASAETGVSALVVVPFGFGLGLLAALFAVGEVSGGHFNPAVSFAALIDRRIDMTTFIAYVIAQVGGGVFGSLLLLFATDQDMVANTVTGGESTRTMFLTELYLTGIFVWVILAVTTSEKLRNQAFAAISLTLAAVHFAGIPFSGASVNPARSLGPAIVGNEYTDIWVYIVAPLVGALVGWMLWSFAHKGEFKLDVKEIVS